MPHGDAGGQPAHDPGRAPAGRLPAMTTAAPAGSWKSEITVEMITAGSVRLDTAALDGTDTYWTEARADQGGRVALWRLAADGTRTEVTPEHNVRSMVHEYGGSAWAVRDGVVVHSSLPSHQCFAIVDGQQRPLTPADAGLRYAAFEIHPERNLVLAVREDHRESDLDCTSTVVTLRLDSDNADGGTVLCSGADFYASPTLSPEGRLAWVEWDHPSMPWDATRLMVARLHDDLTLGKHKQRAGTATSAPGYPLWVGEELYFLDDPDGWWNLYRARGKDVERVTTPDAHDWAYPHWVFHRELVALDGGRIACRRYVDGVGQLVIVQPDGTWAPVRGAATELTLAGSGETLVAVVSYADRPDEVARHDLATGTWTTLRTSADLALGPEWISVPQQRTWESDYGPVYAWYYPPTNPGYRLPDGELPPLKVLSHGGPTGFAQPVLKLDRQYWTSRGWAVLDVNYGGSAGYGRAYRERLQGRWGVLDVTDCADGARAVVAAGLADPKRLAIEGGSAGGFTTLAALTSTDTFAAGNSLYGIGDLVMLASDTHKFESRYVDGLVGGTPQEVPEVYAERSPVNHLDRLSCPMLIQQGADDKVVPPSQATAMADAVRAKGLPVALRIYEGEGHGFRRAETIQASLEGALSFFGQVFGYEPAGVPPIAVENL